VLRLETLDEGTKTRIFRVSASLSQYDLASRAGVDRRRISEYERGERSLREEELARGRAVLNIEGPHGNEEPSCALA
jgi:transcriptional regulator with XRE-family HTH domain